MSSSSRGRDRPPLKYIVSQIIIQPRPDRGQAKRRRNGLNGNHRYGVQAVRHRKSTSLRNFKPEDVCIVNVFGKPLPFKNKYKTFNTDDYMSIETAIKKAPAKSIVIDDATYLMTGEYMRTAKVTGYQKFSRSLALNCYTPGKIAAALPDDKNRVFHGGTATSTTTETKSSRPSGSCWTRRSLWKVCLPSF